MSEAFDRQTQGMQQAQRQYDAQLPPEVERVVCEDCDGYGVINAGEDDEAICRYCNGEGYQYV